MNNRKLLKKAIIILVCIILFLNYFLFYATTKRGIIDYYRRSWKGQYETNVEVTKQNDDSPGRFTVFVNNTYVYYDMEKTALCNYDTGEVLGELNRVPDVLLTNGKYIYAQNEEKLYQYDLKGNLIAQTYGKGVLMFAGKDSVYCNDFYDGCCYILSAENIAVAGEEPDNISHKYEDLGIAVMLETKECYLGGEITDCGLEVEITEEYIKVFNENDFDYSICVISKEAGIESSGMYLNCLGIFADTLYAGQGVDKIQFYKESLDEQSKCVLNSPTYKTRKMNYSRSLRDGEYLILLGENYLTEGIGNSGTSSDGNVGEYDAAILSYIDLEKSEVVKEYSFSDEQVIYMSAMGYATMEDGNIKIYDASDGKLLKQEIIESYEAGQDYSIEICNGNIFVFCNGDLLERISVK